MHALKNKALDAKASVMRQRRTGTRELLKQAVAIFREKRTAYYEAKTGIKCIMRAPVAIVATTENAAALAARMTAAILAKRAAIGEPVRELPAHVAESVAFLANLEAREPARTVPSPRSSASWNADVAALVRMGWTREAAESELRELNLV